MKFVYEIDELGDINDIEERFSSSRDPDIQELIRIKKNENGALTISANERGWLYLAKVCVEMAYTNSKDPLFHLHRTSDFKFSEDQSQDAVELFQLIKAAAK